jgi:hypothetical protein
MTTEPNYTDARQTVIDALRASKGWMTAYAEAFVDDLLSERQAAMQGQGVDTGNLVSDPLYLALDALYARGWNDSERHKCDARGTKEWQAVLDLFRSNAALQPPQPVRSVSDEDKAIGSWLSAALDDPKVCAEMKRDINAWLAQYHFAAIAQEKQS